MESWMRELAFHKDFVPPDSCPDHRGPSGFWTLCHRKGKQKVTVVCGEGGPSEIPPKGMVLGRYVHPGIGGLSLKLGL